MSATHPLTDHGIPFTARLLLAGDRYGRSGALIHKGAPVVEFYDARFSHTGYGQFIASYVVSTFQQVRSGLCLDGGNAACWSLSAESVRAVQEWLAA